MGLIGRQDEQFGPSAHLGDVALFGGGGVQPQKTQKNPNPKWDFKLFLGFLGFFGFFGFFLEKGVESTFLNIPDHLRPTCFLHLFRAISPGSDTYNIFHIQNFNFSQKNQPRQIFKGLNYLLKSTRVTLQWARRLL